MTQEEKAKAYDEALGKAKKELNTCSSQDCDAARQIFRLFPELKESEDDRVRKELIEFVDINTLSINERHDKWIAWLEKQGEQKSNPCDECINRKGCINCENGELRETEQKPTIIDIDKMVNDYANNNEPGNQEFGKPVSCMIRAYRQGINDILRLSLNLEKSAWSEEDETVLNNLIYALANDRIGNNRDEYVDWLKSLRPQNT